MKKILLSVCFTVFSMQMALAQDSASSNNDHVNWLEVIGVILLILLGVKWVFDLIYFLLCSKEDRQEILHNGDIADYMRWAFGRNNENTFIYVLKCCYRFIAAILILLLMDVAMVITMSFSHSDSEGSSRGGSSSGGSFGGGSSGGGGYSGRW